MEDHLKTVKMIAEAIGATGTGFVVKRIIANNLEEPENLRESVQITVGSFMIGAMVSRQARLFTEEKIDSAVKKYAELKAKIEEAKKEQVEPKEESA